jgi:hypothetical protein
LDNLDEAARKDIFIQKVIKLKSNILEFDTNLKEDYMFIDECCLNDGMILEFASEEIKDDKDVVITAVK